MNRIICMAAVILAASITGVAAQVKESKEARKAREIAATDSLVEGKAYVFMAERMFPPSGQARILNSRWELEVNGDTLTVYLPYFVPPTTSGAGNSSFGNGDGSSSSFGSSGGTVGTSGAVGTSGSTMGRNTLDTYDRIVNLVTNGFTYKSERGKKGQWHIDITTQDAGHRYEIDLAVYGNGTASLTMSDISRKSIRFSGKIMALPEKEE